MITSSLGAICCALKSPFDGARRYCGESKQVLNARNSRFRAPFNAVSSHDFTGHQVEPPPLSRHGARHARMRRLFERESIMRKSLLSGLVVGALFASTSAQAAQSSSRPWFVSSPQINLRTAPMDTSGRAHFVLTAMRPELARAVLSATRIDRSWTSGKKRP